MTRTTIDVQWLRRVVNRRLARPDRDHDGLTRLSPHQAYRRGMADLLESVLHATDTYGGVDYPAGPDGTPDTSRPRFLRHDRVRW